MNTVTMSLSEAGAYELRFQSLFNEGRALAFPCDADGHVDMDALSERARGNYLYARAVVGREYATPAVQRCH
ncbi:MAG: hypothetical protein AB7U92_08410 [Piscinibacter sp.]|uniref:hypothetical protein n=1 Tax=Piscinibacter sp. TaxID=1903157 RepID=UPI003D0D8865